MLTSRHVFSVGCPLIYPENNVAYKITWSFKRFHSSSRSDFMADEYPFLGRAIYQFQPQLEDELKLNVGDAILVLKAEDRYWFYGRIADRTGRLPRSHVTRIQLPLASTGQVYFVSLAQFTQQQPGDLSFNRGDVLIGLNAVDSSWWYGRSSDGREGIFPLTLVWQVDLLSKQDQLKASKFTSRKGHVTQDLKAQLAEELDLKKGDEVIVTGEEDGWYTGIFQGKTGIFPTSFVQLLEEIPEETCIINRPETEKRITFPAGGMNNPPLTRPHAIACFDFNGTYEDELSLKEGQIVYLLNRINDEWMRGESQGLIGIFPTAFVNVIIDCDVKQHDNHGISTGYLTHSVPQDNHLTQQLNDTCVSSYIGPGSRGEFDSLCSTNRFGSHQREVGHNNNEADKATMKLKLSRPSQNISIDNIITKNLVEFESSKACLNVAQRRSSWSNVEINLQQINRATNSSRHHINTDVNTTTNTNTVEVPATPLEISESHPLTHETDSVSSNDYLNDINEEVVNIAGPSYTRPAPPPPLKSRSSTSSLMSSTAAPTRPAPPVPHIAPSRQCKSVQGDGDSLSTSSSQTDYGSDGFAEDCKQKSGEDKAPRMEEEQLRHIEMRNKNREQRCKVIQELIDTEKEFCRDLKLTRQVFRLDDPEFLKDINISILFGNFNEVIELSDKFIEKLEAAVRDSGNTSDISIGNHFISLQSEFRRVYRIYCTNHDDAQTSLEKYENNPVTNKLLQQGLDRLREYIVCFNMGAIIIKPVQRITKYPLIINELIKSTETDHPDRANLLEACSLMTSIASYINESKRKKEIVLKYRDTGTEDRISRRLSRINIHSVTKKSLRIGMMLKTSLGFTPAKRDLAFEEAEERFNELLRASQTALRDISAICEQLKTTFHVQFNISEAVASYYGDRSRSILVENFRTVQRTMLIQHWSAFDTYVALHVRDPLTALCEACQGPERLVQKRRDKLLDYEIANERLSKNKDPGFQRVLKENEQLARNNYEALNSQLLEELPTLTKHGCRIYQRCISSFLYARKLLVGRATKQLLDLTDMKELSNLQLNILEEFALGHSRAVERLSNVTFISKNLRSSVASGGSEPSNSPRLSPSRRMSREDKRFCNSDGMAVQSMEKVNQLRAKYSPEQLYRVTHRCDVKEPLDIAANPGLLVAAIKHEDPTGRKNRWFVDAGDVFGFIPQKYLVPVVQANGNNRLSRAESTMSETSSASSAAERNSMERIQEFLQSEEKDQELGKKKPEYDLPPSYEEIESLSSPHRYDIVCESSPTQEENATIATNELKADSKCQEVNRTTFHCQADGNYAINTSLAIHPSFIMHDVWKASFPFQARSPMELDIQEGQCLLVLAKSDLANNSEWWLVENDDGQKGYVPASYLSQLIESEPHFF